MAPAGVITVVNLSFVLWFDVVVCVCVSGLGGTPEADVMALTVYEGFLVGASHQILHSIAGIRINGIVPLHYKV